MSGIEILGAVAASLQLLDTCSAIGQFIFKLPANGKMADKVESNCHCLLQYISASLIEFSRKFYRPAQALAEELQSIHATVGQRKRHKFLRIFGSGDQYRQRLLMAIGAYNSSAMLAIAATMQKLGTDQSRGSQEILEKLSTLKNEFQSLNDKTSEMKIILEGVTKVGAPKQVREEFAAARNKQPIAAILAGQNLSGGITPELGTMAEYLGRTGGATSDQDIWECFYDIVSVYINNNIPVNLRYRFPRLGWLPRASFWRQRIWGSCFAVLSLIYCRSSWMLQTDTIQRRNEEVSLGVHGTNPKDSLNIQLHRFRPILRRTFANE
jgi:hypothetical protein